jgi:hypothetical protein
VRIALSDIPRLIQPLASPAWRINPDQRGRCRVNVSGGVHHGRAMAGSGRLIQERRMGTKRKGKGGRGY